MNIPYRTRRLLNRIGFISLILVTILVAFWICWVIFVERYVVYTQDGAHLDMSYSSNDLVGEVAAPPVAGQGISIYYNEGSNSTTVGNELTQLNGYYIDEQTLKNVPLVWEQLAPLPAGTPIMIDLKGGYGSFFYSSHLSDALRSASTDVAAVDELIVKMKNKGFYLIARVSAFRDYSFGLNHVPSGLYLNSRKGLWADSGGCYWMNPTDSTTLNWVSSVVLEIKAMGFDEVVLSNFCFPDSTGYIFRDDKDAALENAAKTLMTNCGSDTFTLSFTVNRADFPLPEGRCRIYLENVSATDVAAKASTATMENPEIFLVFVAQTNDTRYNSYGVLRPLSAADVLEAQKAEQAEAD